MQQQTEPQHDATSLLALDIPGLTVDSCDLGNRVITSQQQQYSSQQEQKQIKAGGSNAGEYRP